MDNLFKEVGEIVQQSKIAQNESLKRGERFNVFAAVKVDHYETRHSAFIAELLNPEGSHGQRTTFLSSFLKVCCPKDFEFSLLGVEVYTEFSTDSGRIDILVRNNKKQGFVIENKIYANDGEEQLIRYNDKAHELFPNGYKIFYLTLNGEEASEQSAKGVDYLPISYQTDIIKWLEECVRKCVCLPLIRETLIQYINHIKKLTNQDMDNNEKNILFNKMICYAEEIETIVKVANDGYTQFVWDKYVSPKFEAFAKTNELQYDNNALYFHRAEWRKTAVKIYAEGGRHYIGVSSTRDGSLDDLSKLSKQQLSCLSEKPTDWWPYGNQWLTPFVYWDAGYGTIPAMIDGRFAKFIIEKVTQIIEEIDRKGIKMP